MSDADKQDDSGLTPEERLHRDNEIERLKLSAFYGMDFRKAGDLSPKLENEWLKYITAFEEQFENGDQISVANRLGNPKFPLVSELSTKEISEKLNEAMALMWQNGISLDSLTEVSETELYRFITEELFFEKIDDIDIEGMMTCFIYEDFHPNARYDIESTIENFIQAMLSKQHREFMKYDLAGKCESQNGDPLTKEAALNKALAFEDCFDRFTINSLSSFQTEIFEEEKEAQTTFLLDYTARAGTEKTEFKGQGQAKLKKGELGYWNLYALRLPGFEL